MNKYHIVAVIFLILAVLSISASVASGEDAFHLFLIFPIITVNSLLSGLGALFILLFFIFMFIGFASGYELVGWDEFQRENNGESKPKGQGGGQPQKTRKSRIEGGGVVLIGPIPIVFGSNQKLTLLIVIVTFAIMVVAMLFFISM
jgi:uncharacterized protein (TIGR00304 family)